MLSPLVNWIERIKNHMKLWKLKKKTYKIVKSLAYFNAFSKASLREFHLSAFWSRVVAIQTVRSEPIRWWVVAKRGSRTNPSLGKSLAIHDCTSRLSLFWMDFIKMKQLFHHGFLDTRSTGIPYIMDCCIQQWIYYIPFEVSTKMVLEDECSLNTVITLY